MEEREEERIIVEKPRREGGREGRKREWERGCMGRRRESLGDHVHDCRMTIVQGGERPWRDSPAIILIPDVGLRSISVGPSIAHSTSNACHSVGDYVL